MYRHYHRHFHYGAMMVVVTVHARDFKELRHPTEGRFRHSKLLRILWQRDPEELRREQSQEKGVDIVQ